MQFAHVAIDGPVGSGKTTVARRLADRLGMLYLDSGAMYRAVAFVAMRNEVPPDDEAALLALALEHPIDVRPDASRPLGFQVLVGELALGPELYHNDVSTIAAVVATHPAIRSVMVGRQREIALGGPVVMAGRDIGTVVLPDAPVKVFLTASVDRRVERRLSELAARGEAVDRLVLKALVMDRDRLDEGRAVAPLRPAPGAFVLDSSELSVEDVVDRISERIRAAKI